MITAGDNARRINVAIREFREIVGRGVEVILREAPEMRLVDRLSDLLVPAADSNPLVIVFDADRASSRGMQELADSGGQAVGLVGLRGRGRTSVHVRRDEPAQLLSKDASAAELIVAVQFAAGWHEDGVGDTGKPPDVARLTPRERQVFRLIAAGETHSEIAERLHITVETARSHTASIRRKLDASSNRELREIHTRVSK
jgi:DNA-binding NarL/FixJ family response regulator